MVGSDKDHHGAGHSGLELRLIEHVVQQGWLAGTLKPKPKPKVDIVAKRAANAVKRLARAERRLKLARTIVAKWRAKVRYYQKRALP